MRITLVAALAKDRVIGRGSEIPWRLPADQRQFRELTIGHHVILGRLTFEAIGKPLPKRTSVVVSRSQSEIAGAIVVPTLERALEVAREAGEDEAFVIGGGEIYRLALPLADALVLTRVHATVEGDVFFPPFDPDAFRLEKETFHPADDRNEHDFTVQHWVRS